MEFTLGGQHVELTREDVAKGLKGVPPEALHQHVVVVDDQNYPVKQAVAVVTGLDRLDFTSAQARSVLKRLGFELQRIERS